MEDNRGNILMYQTVDGKTAIEVMLSNDTVWLTIDKMAELFQRNKSTISRHIKNILECGELTAESTVAFFATVQKEGKRNVEREIIYERADADKDFMGLTTWTGALPTRTDAEYAKNYLSAEEIETAQKSNNLSRVIGEGANSFRAARIPAQSSGNPSFQEVQSLLWHNLLPALSEPCCGQHLR